MPRGRLRKVATGYGMEVILEKYRQCAVLQKPFRKQELEEALLRTMRLAAGGA
jgi:hypothetical protein